MLEPEEKLHPEIEACCEACRVQIEREPKKANLIMAECQTGTRITDYQSGGEISWD